MAGHEVLALVAHQPGSRPTTLLEKSLLEGGFWGVIEEARARSGRGRDTFRIVIKPDLDTFERSARDATDPALVEHLVDLLHDRRFGNVVVGDGRNGADGWLHNREALVVPDLAGYRFETQRGRPYEVVDLGAMVAEPDVASPDDGTPIGPAWQQADFRICFAKNRTHETFGYALCVHNLAGVVVARRPDGLPRRRSAVDDCLAVLRAAPPHFCIIDAHTSCHGGAGQRAPVPIETHAFIVSRDPLLADWVGAAKMGLDPYASPVNARALHRIGLPINYRIDGELAPYPLWRNVHPLLARSATSRARCEGLGAIAEAWFQRVDREHYPFRDFYGDRINSFIAPLMAEVDDNPRSFLLVVLANEVIAAVGSAVETQHTMFSKGRLRRREEPLELDPDAFGPADFAAIPHYLAPYEQLVGSLPADRMGMRWRHVEGTVLFCCSHLFPIGFDDFVARVDIAQAIRYMNDYIGGSTVTLRRDRRGRVVHQMERNLYLQQPNWMALLGGDLIDVEKLELVSYGRNSRSIAWRTVSSANNSASHDDGRVTFRRDGAGRTVVTIFTRQQFSLPPLLRLFDIGLAPGLRDPIIENAYARYFTGTIANLQATYDGREYRIGRASDDEVRPEGPLTRDLARYLATAVAAGAELLRHRGEVADFGSWLFPSTSLGAPVRPPSPMTVDRDGFRHFPPAAGGWRGDERAVVAGMAAVMRDAPDYLAGFAEAVQRDLERMADPAGEGVGP